MSAFKSQPKHSSNSTPQRVASNASILTNKQAFHEESLYYICLRLLTRLTKIPHMMPFVELAHAQAEDLAQEQNHLILHAQSLPQSQSLNWSDTIRTFAMGILPQQLSYDPVTSLSNLFKMGAPLCLIYNALRENGDPLEIVTSDDVKVCKMSIYKFLLACKQNLNIRDDELFPVTMIFSNDTGHLLRVIQSVESVLNLDPNYDCLPLRDQLMISMDSKSKVVKELVETERKFVQDLETLVKYRQDLLSTEWFTSEHVNLLFPNLLEIIDFQRRFLIGLECQVNAGSFGQRIGSIFLHAGVNGFQLYESWALLQNSVMEFISREMSRLERASSIIKDPFELQNFFLIKPIQRLTKYPLLLKQLIKESDPHGPYYQELVNAYEITKEVARGINEAQRRSENMKHLEELKSSVVDWKGYTTANIGDLLYFNVVTVKDLLTDGHSNEKEVHCYLFERVIYFFKEVSARSKLLNRKPTFNTNGGNLVNGFNGFQLVLNGIVYINKITRSSISDSSLYFNNQQGHYLSLKWKGNKDTGGCIMRFRSEEQLLQWDGAIRKLSEFNEPEDIYSSSHSSESFGSFNRNSTNSTGVINNGSMSRMRTASTSSFNTSMGSYPPLPSEKKLRSVSVASTSSTNTRYRKSSSNTSIGPDELLANVSLSNLSNLTISKPYSSGSATPTLLGFMDKTFIRLVFGKSITMNLEQDQRQSSINLSVSSELLYDELVSVLLKKVHFALGMDKTFKFKYRDEDGDLVRFTGDDDWEMAKDSLTEDGILELVVEDV